MKTGSQISLSFTLLLRRNMGRPQKPLVRKLKITPEFMLRFHIKDVDRMFQRDDPPLLDNTYRDVRIGIFAGYPDTFRTFRIFFRRLGEDIRRMELHVEHVKIPGQLRVELKEHDGSGDVHTFVDHLCNFMLEKLEYEELSQDWKNIVRQ